MPEMPQMQGLSERVGVAIVGRALDRYELLGFSGLKTVIPSPEDLLGVRVELTSRRGKYLVIGLENKLRVLIHLSQAGRLDIETPAKATKPRGSVVRLVFSDDVALLVREHGTQRKARWWIVGPDEEGPLETLGPEPFDEEFESLIMTSDSTRHLHTVLRDQHTVAGIGRGYADDALNRAGLSPFAPFRTLDTTKRKRLVASIRSVLDEALALERTRTGGLSEAKLGERFLVHNRAGQPCPICAEPLLRVSFESHEIVYCKQCQTNGRALADRRLSRLLK
jgi:formamidopyrimidine-DNA glycosylase